MLRPGLNKAEVRGGMKKKTEEAEHQKEEWETKLEAKKKQSELEKEKQEGIRRGKKRWTEGD